MKQIILLGYMVGCGTGLVGAQAVHERSPVGSVQERKEGFMLSELQIWSTKLKDGWDLAHDFYFQSGKDLPAVIRHVAFMGMGGSGIAGRIAKMALDRISPIPVTVIDSVTVPAFLDSNSLVFVCSYSGNTWETEQVLKELIERRIPAVAITHGGRIAQIADEHALPYLLMPPSKSPRSALGVFLGTIFSLLDLMGLMPKGREMVKRFIAQADCYVERFLDQEYFKPFLGLAATRPFFHVWGVGGDSAACAFRAQTQFNENSKVQAVSSVFSELSHNLLEGFESLSTGQSAPLVVMLHTDFLEPKLMRSLEVVGDLLREKGVQVYKPAILGDTWDEQFFHIILWSDFASYYLGQQLQVDIEAVPLIEELKRRLQTKHS